MVRITPRTLSFAVLIGLVLFSFDLDTVSAQEKVVRIAHEAPSTCGSHQAMPASE